MLVKLKIAWRPVEECYFLSRNQILLASQCRTVVLKTFRLMNTLDRKLDHQETKISYKKVVWFYNFWSWLTESRAAAAVIRFASIMDNQRVIEIACGTGIVFEKIVSQNPSGHNTGIDLSPDMLGKARERLRKSKFSNYELKEGNVLGLDFKDNSFDVLVNNFMIDLMPENTFDMMASEFYRILNPGGIAVISTFSFGEKKINHFWHWVAKKFPALLTGCRPVAFRPHLEKAGFVIEEDLQISQNAFPSEVLRARKPRQAFDIRT